jgi:hypothetical protein
MKGEKECQVQINISKTYLNDATERIHLAGKNAINSFATGDEQRVMLMGLKRFTKVAPINTKEIRRSIADYYLEKNEYPF